ncbi:Predicted cobalt transporter CbtC [hydrothermal vent metagenome]|uniref:Predicted cobalt transporter CbtC n=1 Tax=hydrothermal vent metagenome TaxID=652676 RepID=A0A1W1BFS2_9ZZZZ
MHIEAGVVDGAKILLSYGTGAGVIAMTLKLAVDNLKNNSLTSLILKSIISTIIVFICFQVLPHFPVGISEVHLILGTTIFLVFGIAPALIGLALGLLIQGVFFAQFDLPQYGINVTTLLASMMILDLAVKKIIPEGTAYKDISYSQMLKMSIIWEGAIVSWVAFWAFYGQGFGAENISNILSFGSAYMAVIIIEPFVDMAILSAVKAFYKEDKNCTSLFDKRLCKA